MLDKLRSRLVHFGPSLMSVPVKLAPFALKRQVLEQLLGWQFRQALADDELAFLEGRWLGIEVHDIGLRWFTSVENDKLIVREQAEAVVYLGSRWSTGGQPAGRRRRQLQRRRQRSVNDRRAQAGSGYAILPASSGH